MTPLGLLAAMQLAAQLAILAADSDGGGGNILISLLPFLLIGVVMYLLLIRPQRKRMREQADLQKAVGVGDEVVTTSGVFGFITGEDGPQRFWLEIDENVQIRISRAAVQQKVDTSAEDEQATDDDEPVGELEPADEHDDAADEVEDESAEHTDES
jgi:preprotein translocase subunit YajC